MLSLHKTLAVLYHFWHLRCVLNSQNVKTSPRRAKGRIHSDGNHSLRGGLWVGNRVKTYGKGVYLTLCSHVFFIMWHNKFNNLNYKPYNNTRAPEDLI